MYLLGYDVGSSSVKASLVHAETGECLAADFFPKQEAKILAPQKGWAEQDPESWWNYLKQATQSVLDKTNIDSSEIKAIGISYQMHGLVCVDKNQKVLRPSIIWCDSRAAVYGNKAAQEMDNEYCFTHLYNFPGNFTASKLAWVKENQPELYEKIDKIMLPGDYIAMKLSGEVNTTASGLSEGVFYDFKKNKVSEEVLSYFGFDANLIPTIQPTFGLQCAVNAFAAKELGLAEGTPISYRAGDQPNNALSLNVFEPGEVAATAGTSGVVYGVTDSLDRNSNNQINVFAHVNHSEEQKRLGVLLCLNGAGALNSWVRNQVFGSDFAYNDINAGAADIPVGSDGVTILPFGNGVERMLDNKSVGCECLGLDFNRHNRFHLARAAQEGIAFSFNHGMKIMQSDYSIKVDRIHAGFANMFMSPIFVQTLSNASDALIELYDTDGAAGAAKAAGIGVGIYKDRNEAFSSLKRIKVIEPTSDKHLYQEAMNEWESKLAQYKLKMK